MKSLRNLMFFIVFAIGSYHVMANSLDDYAINAVAKNLVANQALLFCKGPKLTVKSLVESSKVLNVDEEKVKVITKLKGCHYSSVLSYFMYKEDVTKIVGMSSSRFKSIKKEAKELINQKDN